MVSNFMSIGVNRPGERKQKAAEAQQLNYFRGRVALCAILRALGMGQGDTVAIQAFTCVAVPEAILASGASPVYIDIGLNSVNMDADDLARKITSTTKAIVVQHTYGIPADMAPLLNVATLHGVPIIEDCCHTFSSTYEGQRVGSFGVASFYSYEWGKPIVAGIGGSAVADDPKVKRIMLETFGSYEAAPFVSELRNNVQYLAYRMFYQPRFYWPVRSLFRKLSKVSIFKGSYNPVDANSVPHDFSSRMLKSTERRLMGAVQLGEDFARLSELLAECYQQNLKSAAVRFLDIPRNSNATYVRFPFLSNDKGSVLEKARKNSVEIADWYNTPVHPLQEDEWHRVKYRRGWCPEAEKRTAEILTLPIHKLVNKRFLQKVLDCLS